MKKALSIILTLCLILTLAACGGTGDSEGGEPSDGTNTPSGSTPSGDTATGENSGEPSNGGTPTAGGATLDVPSVPGSTVGGGGKTLVVYYSARDHTERVAQIIADTLGADTFELEPAEPYTSDDLDWTDRDSRVSKEHEDEAAQNSVALTNAVPDNWDSYDTVFVGYPIWWGIAAWPVNEFVTANDFTGKTVIPFCTSSSSGLGQSGELLAQMAGEGDWQEGKRFSSGVSEDDVKDWVSSLDLPSDGEINGSVVYFTSDISSDGMLAVYEALGWTPTGNVAVKLSTGEPPASNYLRPELIEGVVKEVNGTIVECKRRRGQ